MFFGWDWPLREVSSDTHISENKCPGDSFLTNRKENPSVMLASDQSRSRVWVALKLEAFPHLELHWHQATLDKEREISRYSAAACGDAGSAWSVAQFWGGMGSSGVSGSLSDLLLFC